MPNRQFENSVHASPEALFAALADVESWPAWDHALEWVRAAHIEGGPRVNFRLKPKGRPPVGMRVVGADAPHRFAVEAALPLARMRTEYRFETRNDGLSRVSVTVTTLGLLGWLWDRLIAAGMDAEAVTHARDLAAFARRQ
jgi:uncharacterized protein YndB with AHSA1/START domain